MTLARLAHEGSVTGCDNCGRVLDLYHFDSTVAVNPMDQAALCDECNTLAVNIDEAIAEAVRESQIDAGYDRTLARRDAARVSVGLALAERFHDWHAGRVAALMAIEVEKRDPDLWLTLLGSHMRDAHDFRALADKMEAAGA